MTNDLTKKLLASDEPSVRYKVLVNVLGKGPRSAAVRAVREEVRKSERVRTLLSERDALGRIPCHPYKKWFGAHWVLGVLADIGYPPGDTTLVPLREQTYGWLLGPEHIKRNLKVLEGRVRRCSSQESNALYATLTLGIADERADELARRLIQWQWPDGGWNCDKNPDAATSSFHETILPLRALALYARLRNDDTARQAAGRAAEVFLKRRLFRRLRDGQVMHPEFLNLHYPCYWHYDVLMGLKVLAEVGMIADKRCEEALNWLQSRQSPEGGWPADKAYYNHRPSRKLSGFSLVDWGPTGRTRPNEWVTADALFILAAARRLTP